MYPNRAIIYLNVKLCVSLPVTKDWTLDATREWEFIELPPGAILDWPPAARFAKLEPPGAKLEPSPIPETRLEPTPGNKLPEPPAAQQSRVLI